MGTGRVQDRLAGGARMADAARRAPRRPAGGARGRRRDQPSHCLAALRAPTRRGFMVRNRVIAALSRGTLVVEAALRSGALNTARHARELNRPVMAVPGPITSEQSAGCHELIMQSQAACVTGARDIMELVAPLGAAANGSARPPAMPADDLRPVTAPVPRAVAPPAGRGPATSGTRAPRHPEAAHP